MDQVEIEVGLVVEHRPDAVARVGQSYTTPTSVGEQLARGVWGLISGNQAAQPKGITTENARTAFRQGELQAERTTTAWGGPSRSTVPWRD